MYEKDCKKVQLSDEQINALSLLDEKISILLIKKFAIINEALGKPMPDSVSGSIGNLVVDTSKGRIPTIKLTSFKNGQNRNGVIEVVIGDIMDIYYPDTDVCHDFVAGMSCLGECPC